MQYISVICIIKNNIIILSSFGTNCFVILLIFYIMYMSEGQAFRFSILFSHRYSHNHHIYYYF